ncbi:MAG: alkaline phosphatase family protein [Pseudomonadota bacterium]
MRKFLLAAAGAALFAAQASAIRPVPPPPAPKAPPKLLVVIAIDQMSADLFDEYRPQFTAGFERLASGTVLRNGYQSHATTDTCAGHSTMLTGDRPARTGIVANAWLDPTAARADKTIQCAEDESAPKHAVSARHLLVPTLGELMKRQWPASRTVAVSGKDRAAVMMSGQRPDQRWYWTGKRFETDLSSAPVPTVVPKVNAAAAAGLAQARPPLDPTPFCAAKATPYTVAPGKSVGRGRLGRAAGDDGAFEASPEFDGDTLALAAGLVDELRLGRGPSPDLLAISLSATDHVGHAFGTEGEEMCLQLTELDRELGDFFRVLDARGIDYAVALTADHGGKDIPERERQRVAGAVRVSAALRAETIGTRLANALGVPGKGLFGGANGDIYVDRSLPAATQRKLIDQGAAAFRADPQVEAVFTAAQIEATPLPTTPPDRWSLIERVRAGYVPGRSGDFYVILKKDVTPITDPGKGSVATHGSPWDYDRRVPIIFWRPGIPGSTIQQPAETVDIMPTLAATVALPVAVGSVDGRCLPQAAPCASYAASPSDPGQR